MKLRDPCVHDGLQTPCYILYIACKGSWTCAAAQEVYSFSVKQPQCCNGCICVRPQGSNILGFFSSQACMLMQACLAGSPRACAGCLSLLLLQGAEWPFVVTGPCICWSRLVNELEACTLAFDKLRFKTISSWRISCKLWFMVLRPKLRTSSCTPTMKVDDILATGTRSVWLFEVQDLLGRWQTSCSSNLLLEAAWSCWLLHSASQICRLVSLPVPQQHLFSLFRHLLG